MADLYERLGLKRGADEAAIKRAYRTLAKELHPDRNKDNPKAADRFSEVTQAYDILADKDKRAQYDRGEIDEKGDPKSPFGFGGGSGKAGNPFRGGGGGGFSSRDFGGGNYGGSRPFGGDGGFDPEDLLNELFGGGRARTRPGSGPGGGPSGFQQTQARPQKGTDVKYRLAVDFTDAAELRPQRVTLRSGKTIEVKLPQGFEDGQTIRLTGQGEAGPGGTGDALITLSIKPHRHFRKDGDDIRIDLPVRLSEAVLGAKVKVPTTSGSVMLTIPKATNGGTVMRLKGKGFSRKDGSRGDLLVTIEIAIPKEDPELEAFVRDWTADEARDPRAGLGG
ncbi:molecular chaperone DnaJ [Pacificimonas flava]|uniref:Molecular chaperone DnaJ n=2 Tax=Pacificimonas TaxID=1960290 RepID=A0A219B0G6_9SPHN|nr:MULTISPECIES: J domain-containing protein [Pacificimonas]MBZ6379717.1 J domain-containing protein [Pacificimonas aurantium]OWV31825.1 molecular chaperone DnaJ [Pacificimonas flava]